MVHMMTAGQSNLAAKSSRRLEWEARRNIELMWLTRRLASDFKTIVNLAPLVIEVAAIRQRRELLAPRRGQRLQRHGLQLGSVVA
jgi:hypothetical protein